METIYGGPTGLPVVDAHKELGAVGVKIANFLNVLDDRTAKARKFEAEAHSNEPRRLNSVIGRLLMRPINFVAEGSPGFLANLAKSNARIGWVATGLSAGSGLGVHATSCIPLAAVLEMVDSKSIHGAALRQLLVSLVLPDDIKAAKTTKFKLKEVQCNKTSPHCGPSSSAGLLVMICPYVNNSASSPSDTDIDPKKKTPLMPRTDFKGMLDLTVRQMDEKSAADFRQDLVEIVAGLARFNNLGNQFFTWERPATGGSLKSTTNGINRAS